MLGPADINSKQFTAVRLREGYAQDEVDEFLDEVADQLQVTLTRLAAAEEKLRALERAGDSRPTAVIPIIKEAPPSPSVESILRLAQETADKHIAEAKANAGGIKGTAMAEAARIVAAAEEEAGKIRVQGVADKQAVLDDLEARHGQVSAALDQLQGSGTTIRDALRAALGAYESQVPS